ncbi:NfeD family protein [Microbacterium sp. SLBN-146]|uniref:NfeD family protein n=1 Tax=Microbacterium sp. SLBN-146 TaxID=2768457 RepID=UPI001151BC1F|nr:NfeD family protein [Microbacterium sp. SLBN-146]TQJ32240.1 membrane protein implicated in regulation of membrane protease activity [Microbacterium sp. SLBN-146]
MLPDLTQYLWIAWLVLALVFVIIELLTLEFTFLMLAAGTLVGGLGVNLLGGPWWLQVALAAALSGLLLFTIRPLLLRLLHRGTQPALTNVDALYGMGARVTSPFVDGFGSVRLDNGETWTAKLPDDAADTLGIGTRVKVMTVLGATVEVAPLPSAPSTERSSEHG